MKKYKLLVDSSCDLPISYYKENDIDVTDLIINFGDKTFLDRKEIDGNGIIEMYNKTKIFPKTSTLNIADLQNIFEKYLKDYEHIFYVTISSEISSLYNNALLASKKYDNRVSVLDSGSLSIGFANSILKLNQDIKKELSVDEIVNNYNEKYAKLSKIKFVVNSLDFLYKGGRCSSLSKFIGQIFKIHPVIKIENKKMTVDKILTGKGIEKCVKEFSSLYIDLLKKDNIDKSAPIILGGFGYDNKIVEDFKEAIKDYIDLNNIYVVEVSGIITCHCGPNTFGISFVTNRPI